MRRWPQRRRVPDRLATPAALRVLDLGDLPPGRGCSSAPAVWLGLASHLRWGTESHTTYVGNDTLAAETGLTRRQVQLGLAYLVGIGKVSRGWRSIRGAWVRLLTMDFEGLSPIVRLPPRRMMGEIRRRVRRLRKRAASSISLALGCYVYGLAEHRRLRRVHSCSSTMADVARLLGMTRGGGFNSRLQVLLDVGVLGKIGETWRAGFRIFGKLVEATLEVAIAAMLPPPMRRASSTDDGEARMALMSEAFAAMYPERNRPAGAGLRCA